jgi:hypothetical protein
LTGAPPDAPSANAASRRQVTTTVADQEPWSPVQAIASPQTLREALTEPVPAAVATNVAVTVPHPCPGTQPDPSGATIGVPDDASTPPPTGSNDQYVLASWTTIRSPTCT